MIEKIIPVNELYSCLQGEGIYTGRPHILIRLVGCRLRCQFGESFCDTSFNSWAPEKGKFTLKDIENFYILNPQISFTMITGGGPTMHKSLLPELVDLAHKYNHWVTIETEGSEYVETECDFLSLSPKLKNSVPKLNDVNTYTGQTVTQKLIDQHEKYRTNYTAMNLLINNQINKGKEWAVKPVISTDEEFEELKQLQEFLEIPNNKVFLMPEGVFDEQLNKKREWLFNKCITEGYNYSDRLQIIVYGDRRGV
jgi:7-carboxy-7-deazaguanine synthase